MPKWIHDRADHLMSKNPTMPKSMAFAIATEQHKKTAALGAAPLWRSQAGFTPPGMATAAQRLKKSMNVGVVDPNKGLKPLNIKVGSVGPIIFGVMKQAGLVGAVRALPGVAKGLATGSTDKLTHLNEVAGLGVLAVPGLDTMQSRIRARLAGDKSHDAAEKRQFLGEGAHAALDVGGLAMLAGPSLAHLKHAFAYSSYGGQAAQNPPGMRGRSQIPAFKEPELEVKAAGHNPLHRVGELVTGSRAGKLYDAALRHADDASAGGGHRALKASRKLRALARREEGHVGKVQGALAASAALGAVSDTTGLAEKVRSKEAGIGVGAGMSASQYSGPLSYGPFKMTSGIPAFRSPAMTKHEPAADPAEWMVGGDKVAATHAELVQYFADRLRKIAASMNTATGGMSPAARLSTTQRVGAPKTTGFSGPSIADISKPKGFGTPLPGAQKNQL